MTATRHRGNGPVARTFREALAIADPVERRGWLLDRLWETYEAASGRHYLNKQGDPVANPDGATATKVLALVMVASEGSPELEQKARDAKARLVEGLEALPGLATMANAVEQKRALLSVLKDAAIVAALKPNADVNAAVGTFRVVAQVLGVGKDEDEATEDEMRAMAAKLLEGPKK